MSREFFWGMMAVPLGLIVIPSVVIFLWAGAGSVTKFWMLVFNAIGEVKNAK